MRKISDILRVTRESKHITLDKVSRDTKIKKEFLEAIELGRFQELPSESYAQGFVRNYSKYLGVPLSEAIPLYRREYNARHQVHVVPNFRKTQHKFNRRFTLNTKTFLILGVIAIVAIYIFFQYSSLFFAPKIEITSPTNNQVISGNVVQIEGKTDPYATVVIDNEDTYVNLQGTFKKSEYLFSGSNRINIVAKNRFGKTSTKTITVTVK
jgi:cytoskeletal protein RodZ